MNYTYLLECADKTLYCGWTNDLEKRVKAHNSGLGAKYTKPRRPVALVYYEEFETKEEAMRREAAIKRLTRYEKLRLLEVHGENGHVVADQGGEISVAAQGGEVAAAQGEQAGHAVAQQNEEQFGGQKE